MDHALERKPKGLIELTVTLTPEEFQRHLKRALAELGKTVRLKGFRPGKAPADAVRQHVGEKTILEEAAEQAVRATYPDIVSAEHLTTVGPPSVQVLTEAEGNSFRYRASAALLPSVTLADPTTLTVTRQPVTVTDADVTKTLEDLRDQRRTEQPSFEPVRHGDKVDIDVDVFRDSVPLSGGATRNHPVVIGDGDLVPGFEDQLLGLKPNDVKEFTLTFPADYYQKTLAGKPAQFRVTVKGVAHLDRPAADDAFARSVGAFQDFGQLTAKLKGDLAEERRSEEEGRLERELVDQLIARSTFSDLPDRLVVEEVEKMLDELKHDVTHRGLKFDDYLVSLKKSRDDLKRELAPSAERRVKAALVVRALAERERLQAEREEIERERALLKAKYAAEPEASGRLNDEEVTRYLTTVVVNRKAMRRLKELAGVAERTPDT